MLLLWVLILGHCSIPLLAFPRILTGGGHGDGGQLAKMETERIGGVDLGCFLWGLSWA